LAADQERRQAVGVPVVPADQPQLVLLELGSRVRVGEQLVCGDAGEDVLG
jgi:hypothetical protein